MNIILMLILSVSCIIGGYLIAEKQSNQTIRFIVVPLCASLLLMTSYLLLFDKNIGLLWMTLPLIVPFLFVCKFIFCQMQKRRVHDMYYKNVYDTVVSELPLLAGINIHIHFKISSHSKHLSTKPSLLRIHIKIRPTHDELRDLLYSSRLTIEENIEQKLKHFKQVHVHIDFGKEYFVKQSHKKQNKS